MKEKEPIYTSLYSTKRITELISFYQSISCAQMSSLSHLYLLLFLVFPCSKSTPDGPQCSIALLLRRHQIPKPTHKNGIHQKIIQLLSLIL